MATHWLPCSVSPGQFPNEFAVSGTQYNGKGFSLFAPQELVLASCGGEEGPGWLQVEEEARRGELVLVRLPAQTFETGQYITVNASVLQSMPTPHKVGA